jgi:aspartokinase-like uncharacterized kinase
MTVTIDGIEYLAASDAAEKLSTTETKILMLLKQKALQGDLIDGSWFVTSASLSSYDPEAAKAAALDCKTSCTSSKCSCNC